jgi:hypothetical protein
VSAVIQKSLELTVTVTCYTELDFLKQNWVMSEEWSTRDSLRPIVSCTEIFVWSNTDISAITFTVRCDPEVVTFLKGNWFMSAERDTLDSFRRFLSCTEICVRGITDISGINRYGYLLSGT